MPLGTLFCLHALLKMLLLPEMGNAAQMGNTILEALATALPPSVTIIRPSRPSRNESEVTLSTPNGSKVRVLIEVKPRIEPRDVERIARYAQMNDGTATILIAAPFISKATQTALKAENISYADATGALFLTLDEPLIFIDRKGSDRSPRPEHRELRSFAGPITGRVIRYLCEHQTPLKIRAVADELALNPGNVSRVVRALDREALVNRSEDGTIRLVKWRPLIQRWAPDLARRRKSFAFLQPRGTSDVLVALSNSPSQYALTGQASAVRVAMVAPLTTVQLYVNDVSAMQKELHLIETKRSANVSLIEAFDRVVFERTSLEGDLRYVSPVQAAADLLSSYARDRREGEAYLDWMERNVESWRS